MEICAARQIVIVRVAFFGFLRFEISKRFVAVWRKASDAICVASPSCYVFRGIYIYIFRCLYSVLGFVNNCLTRSAECEILSFIPVKKN